MNMSLITLLLTVSLLLNIIVVVRWVFGEGKEGLDIPASDSPKHHPPEYWRYEGGWANVCTCDCGSVSLYEDNHPVDPCRDCGTKTKRRERSARWVGVKWEFAE